jgi:hypothetical protein
MLTLRRNNGLQSQSAIISAGIAVLATAVLMCAGLILISVGTALVQGWRFQAISDQCSILKELPARQACYDKVGAEESRHPAKGANAPIMLLSPEQQQRH